MSKVIHLISGPRNISTALMYAFGNRPDCSIVDEPMYAVYLSKHQIEHPGREEILNTMSQDLEEVIRKDFCPREGKENHFVKNMSHHFIGIEHSFIYPFENIFLIRDPKALISSFAQVMPNPTIQDIGLKKSWTLFEDLESNAHSKPIVLDSGEILRNPEGVLKNLCDQISIPFTDRMLHWDAGPRKEDGLWAKYWYANVHQSMGFKKQQKKDRELPEHLTDLYEEADKYYQRLFKNAIKA